MRLGAPLFDAPTDPHGWAASVLRHNYSAAYCPEILPGYTPADYAKAASDADIVIAEVGIWNNPLQTDSKKRAEAILQGQEKLALADEIGAACCVNISGSRGEPWDGPDAGNFTPETFGLIVETARELIDAVKPLRTFFTLETMPWMYPNTVESYERLLDAVDRPAFAVHFDPVNLITSPETYFKNGAMIRDFVRRLGPQIKSVHAKDIILRPQFMVHLDEVRPGLGTLDYSALLNAIAPLGLDLPVMLEHLSTENEYRQAAAHIRSTAGFVAHHFQTRS